MDGDNFHRTTSAAHLSPTPATGFTGIRSKILSLSSIQAEQTSQTGGSLHPSSRCLIVDLKDQKLIVDYKTDVMRMVCFLEL